jgi:hypothetical protein
VKCDAALLRLVRGSDPNAGLAASRGLWRLAMIDVTWERIGSAYNVLTSKGKS